MADVFISYAHTTAKQARAAAAALRALGYSVWIDDDLTVHRAFTPAIEEQLTASKAALVVWSADAARSEWVLSEANRAREDDKLVQMLIDKTRLPMPFDQVQCANMDGWSGEDEHPNWSRVVASVVELVGAAPKPAAGPADAAPALGSSRPSVAVMPFTNLSSDPEQAYFVEGMVEEIVGALATFKSFDVVTAGSGVVSNGRVLTPQEAARQLGVGYILEGSVRKAANRVRITVHLIDASVGAEVWADHLDDTLDDVFALQDRVAQRIAGVIENRVMETDERKVVARPTMNMSSYDLYLRSLPLFRVSRKAEMLESIALLDKAIALAPTFAMAQSQACVCLRQVVDHGWSDDPDYCRRRGLELADQALRAGGDDAKVVAQVAAGLPGLEGNLDRAIALVGRALALNPASSFVRLVAGSVQLRNGEPDLAAEHLEVAMRLDPISTMNGFMRMYLASARFQQRRFDEALALFDTTTFRLPVSYAVLAALYGHLGRVDQARKALADLRGVTDCTIDKLASIWFPRPEYHKLLMDGLALAHDEAAATTPSETSP